jgi:hypothetical protein
MPASGGNGITMTKAIADVSAEFGYYDLLGASEKARWKFGELPWDDFDKSKASDGDIYAATVSAQGELTTFSATSSFMQLFSDDLDFMQWLAIWFYEETRHPLALIKWLALAGSPTDEAFMRSGREIAPMTKSKVDMLTFNIVSEIMACVVYQHLSNAANEPLLAEITRNISRDEMRHSVGFEYYCKKAIEAAADPGLERLRALRAVWFLLEPSADGLAQHPVFLALKRVKGVDVDAIKETVTRQILRRFSKLLALELESPDRLYAVYSRSKREYRSAQAAQSGIGATGI